MLKDLTRSKLIMLWFGVVALAVGVAVLLGAAVTVTTALMLFALCLAPAAMVMMLWPGIQPPSANDVLRDRDRNV